MRHSFVRSLVCLAVASALLVPRSSRTSLRAGEGAAEERKKSRGPTITVEDDDADAKAYYDETSALWEPVLEIVDVRCALQAKELLIPGVTTVAQATEALRAGEVDVRRRYRAGESVMLPRYVALQAERRNLEWSGRWAGELETNESRVEAAQALLRGEGAFGKVLKFGLSVLRIDGESAPMGALLSYGSPKTRWTSSRLVEMLEVEIEQIAERAARKRSEAEMEQAGGLEWCRRELGIKGTDDEVLDAYIARKKQKNLIPAVLVAVGLAAAFGLLPFGDLNDSSPDDVPSQSRSSSLDSLLDDRLFGARKQSR